MLQLDNFRIPGKNLVVKGNMELRSEDMAGETSGTESVEKGIKPKILQVSVFIPYTQEQDLSNVIKKAEALDDTKERKIYTITNRTANSVGIRQVKFTDHLNWQEHQTLQLWKVTFSLQEYLSNPERVENQNQEPELDFVSSTSTPQYVQLLKNAEKLIS